jgi:predicted nucleic acid-binding protein
VTVVYLETSALLAWLFTEKRSVSVLKRVDAAEVVVTSSLTFAEAERALVRAEAGGLIRGGDGQRLRGVLEIAAGGWMSMEVSEEILRRAARPFPVEPIRTLDAIHLATALAFTRTFAGLEVLTFDGRVEKNATALGLG